jgi:hypothetical protein
LLISDFREPEGSRYISDFISCLSILSSHVGTSAPAAASAASKSATTREPATGETAAAAAEARERGCRGTRRLTGNCDVGDHLVAFLEVALDHFGILAVCNSEAQPHRPKQVLHETPCAADGLGPRERRKQRVDRRGGASLSG